MAGTSLGHDDVGKSMLHFPGLFFSLRVTIRMSSHLHSRGGQIFPPAAGEMVSDTCVLFIRRKHLPKLKYVLTGHECPSAIEDEESRFVFLQLRG